MSEKNRFKLTKDFLSEVQSEIGKECAVSASYGPEGFSFILSFHNNENIDDEEFIQVDFDESDFQDSEVYENSIIEQLKDYTNENLGV